MRTVLLLLLSTFLCTCGRAPTTVLNAEGPSVDTSSAVTALQAGPMLGYNELREVAVWVQTTRPASVQLAYSGEDGRHLSAPIQTEKATAYTAKLIADEVQPGKTYEYSVLINGQELILPYPTEFTAQELWQWRTDPPDFSVAVGSCTYINEARYDRPGKGYGRGYDIFKSIDAKNPDLMIWLGDNNYLREADWTTRTGYHHRYTHSRSVPEMQALLARTHHYAIWDDHDYGPNDSDRSWVHRELAGETFDLFWANPTSGLETSKQAYGVDGNTTSFRYNDVDFFLLDNRSFRTPNGQVRQDNVTLLGEPQLDWLIENLTYSKARYKVVCVGGQVLNTAEVWENYVNLAPNELRYLLARITEENIEGVVFLTGDRHHTELSKLRLPNGNMVYDVTISPLTSGIGNPKDEVNKNRVDGTLVLENNFGILNFSGPRDERVLTVSVFGASGEVLWEERLE